MHPRAVIRQSEQEEAQKKMEAWMKVASLAEQALKILADVGEGSMDQVALVRLVDKAQIQAQLWNMGGE